jgi:hypothetical protein
MQALLKLLCYVAVLAISAGIAYGIAWLFPGTASFLFANHGLGFEIIVFVVICLFIAVANGLRNKPADEEQPPPLELSYTVAPGTTIPSKTFPWPMKGLALCLFGFFTVIVLGSTGLVGWFMLWQPFEWATLWIVLGMLLLGCFLLRTFLRGFSAGIYIGPEGIVFRSWYRTISAKWSDVRALTMGCVPDVHGDPIVQFTVHTENGPIQFINWFAETELLLKLIGAGSGLTWKEARQGAFELYSVRRTAEATPTRALAATTRSWCPRDP